MADLAPAIVKDIVMTGFAIKKALDTVHQNEEDCQDLQFLMDTLIVIVSRLHNMDGMMSHPMICDTLVGLHRSLNRAHKLVTKCQKRNKILHFFTSKDMANQLRRVQDDIHRKMQLGNLAITASMMEITFEWTRTTTLRYDGTHPLLIQPQQDATEMEIYGSHSLAGGARPVEDVKEIITTVTTGTDTSSALSSSVTEFSFSETVTTPHVSENFNGGGGYTVVTKQKIVIQVGMTCDKSRAKAMSVVAQVAGVYQMGISGDGKDQIVVVGSGVDSVGLISALRKKVGLAMLLQVEDVSRRPTVVNATEESQLAVDLAKVSLVEVASAQEVEQEPATRRPHARSSGGIRSFASKLLTFMRPRRPRSSTCQAAPSSSHPLIEHTDAPAPAPHFFPGESSSSMTTPQVCIHQYQEHAHTSALRGKDGNLLLLENPDLLLPQHQPTAPSGDAGGAPSTCPRSTDAPACQLCATHG